MEQVLLEDRSKHMEDREVVRDGHYGFTKAKTCLATLVAFCNGLTASVDKVRATGIIYLDFCRAFDTIPHIHASTWESDDSDGWIIRWIRNWPGDCIQRVKCSMFKWKPVASTVPQVPVLAPMPCNIFINKIVGMCTSSTSLPVIPS